MTDNEAYYGRPEKERVFDFIDPTDFTEPAYQAAGLEELRHDPDTAKFVLYATQLAIAVHRPQEVLDLERAALEEYIRQQDERREKELQAKYGSAVDDTVTVDGLTVSVPLYDQMVEAFNWPGVDTPAINDPSTYEGELPEFYYSGGSLIWNNPALYKAISEPDPYHPHKGYNLSIELEHLAMAIAGDNEGIRWWDVFGGGEPQPLHIYLHRYEEYFDPWIYLDKAMQDLKLDTSVHPDDRLEVGGRSVLAVLDRYGLATRFRHMVEIPAEIRRKEQEEREEEEGITFRELDTSKEPGVTATDLEVVDPKDFQ